MCISNPSVYWMFDGNIKRINDSKSAIFFDQVFQKIAEYFYARKEMHAVPMFIAV